jgi:hypothetical protein
MNPPHIRGDACFIGWASGESERETETEQHALVEIGLGDEPASGSARFGTRPRIRSG